MVSDSRRSFIKKTVLGAGFLTTGLTSCSVIPENRSKKYERRTQGFNMCGYAAPKLETIRIGIIGLGNRGIGAVYQMSLIAGVEIVALCDLVPKKVDESQKILDDLGLPAAKSYSDTENSWKAVCESTEIDLIYICTPWEWHTPMAVYAMENDKHVAVEVPAATTVDECWQLVETSEKTKKHCMMLENCCYDFFELLTLNMTRQGYFGDIIHGEGGYLHDLRTGIFDRDYYEDMWRLKENASRNGNLYPTHGLGPICQIMDINRGDKMEYLTSMQSADFHYGKLAKEKANEDPYFIDKDFRGNMNTTIVKTFKGRTIKVQHDVSSPRPYSRIHLVSGSEGIACKYPLPGKISKGHEWLGAEEMKEIEEKYTPEIIKRVGEMAKQVGGHGGMDFIMIWRLIDCLRNGLALDQDVYDAALWSVIAPLSEWSVANRSNSIDVPDFTCGAWENNTPVNLTLEGGGTTDIKNFKEVDHTN